MPLPYPTKVVLPFDIATAQDMNERHDNDVALAAGTGLDDGAVTADKIDLTTLRLGSASITTAATSTSAVSSPTAVSGLSVTFTLTATRTIRASLRATSVYNTAASSYNVIYFCNGTVSTANSIGQVNNSIVAASNEVGLNAFTEKELTAGTYTINIGMGRNTGTMTLAATASSPAILTVDIVG